MMYEKKDNNVFIEHCYIYFIAHDVEIVFHIGMKCKINLEKYYFFSLIC